MLKRNFLLLVVFALLAVMIRADSVEDEMKQACGNLPESKQEDIKKKCAPDIADFILDPTAARAKMINCMKSECVDENASNIANIVISVLSTLIVICALAYCWKSIKQCCC